jgi:hypothetical protein
MPIIASRPIDHRPDSHHHPNDLEFLLPHGSYNTTAYPELLLGRTPSSNVRPSDPLDDTEGIHTHRTDSQTLYIYCHAYSPFMLSR